MKGRKTTTFSALGALFAPAQEPAPAPSSRARFGRLGDLFAAPEPPPASGAIFGNLGDLFGVPAAAASARPAASTAVFHNLDGLFGPASPPSSGVRQSARPATREMAKVPTAKRHAYLEVEVLHRHGDLLVHRSIDDLALFTVTEKTSGRALRVFARLSAAVAFAWYADTSPDIRQLTEAVLATLDPKDPWRERRTMKAAQKAAAQRLIAATQLAPERYEEMYRLEQAGPPVAEPGPAPRSARASEAAPLSIRDAAEMPEEAHPAARPAAAAASPARREPKPEVSLQVAETIREQLGGKQFMAMTGATNFLGDSNSLSFTLPAGFAKDGINRVGVTLDERDTYSLRFVKMGRAPNHSVTEIAEVNNVYAENLREVFARHTGLDTSLGKVTPSAAPPAQVRPQPSPAEVAPTGAAAAPAALTAGKATLYYASDMGMGIGKVEVTSITVKLLPSQHRTAISIEFVPKGKRSARRLVESSRPSALVLDGWGHPDPDGMWVGDRGRYASFDPRWQADFDRMIGKYLAGNPRGVLAVLADYRPHAAPISGRGAPSTRVPASAKPSSFAAAAAALTPPAADTAIEEAPATVASARLPARAAPKPAEAAPVSVHLPALSDAERDILGRRLRATGAATSGGITVQIVAHPSVQGYADPQARAFVAVITHGGERSYAGDGNPQYLGEAQDAALRVLRDGTARAATVRSRADTREAWELERPAHESMLGEALRQEGHRLGANASLADADRERSEIATYLEGEFQGAVERGDMHAASLLVAPASLVAKTVMAVPAPAVKEVVEAYLRLVANSQPAGVTDSDRLARASDRLQLVRLANKVGQGKYKPAPTSPAEVAVTRAEAERIDTELERLRAKLPVTKHNAIREAVREAIQQVRDACEGFAIKRDSRHPRPASEIKVGFLVAENASAVPSDFRKVTRVSHRKGMVTLQAGDQAWDPVKKTDLVVSALEDPGAVPSHVCSEAREALHEALAARARALSQHQGDLFAGFTNPNDIAAAKAVMKRVEALSERLDAQARGADTAAIDDAWPDAPPSPAPPSPAPAPPAPGPPAWWTKIKGPAARRAASAESDTATIDEAWDDELPPAGPTLRLTTLSKSQQDALRPVVTAGFPGTLDHDGTLTLDDIQGGVDAVIAARQREAERGDGGMESVALRNVLIKIRDAAAQVGVLLAPTKPIVERPADVPARNDGAAPAAAPASDNARDLPKQLPGERRYLDRVAPYDDTYAGPRWVYGVAHRPPASAAPAGRIMLADRKNPRFAFGTIEYPRELTAKEVSTFELEFVEHVPAAHAPPSVRAPSVRLPAAPPAPPEPTPYVPPPPGLYRFSNGRLYGDSNLLRDAGQIPGFEVHHLGFGEFELRTPLGVIEVDRMHGRDFPGQSGRSHELYAGKGGPGQVELLLAELAKRGIVPTPEGAALAPSTPPAPAWDPQERPITARLTQAQRDAMGFTSPQTLEEHLVQGWDALAGALRGEKIEGNLDYAEARTRAALSGPVLGGRPAALRKEALVEADALYAAVKAAQARVAQAPRVADAPPLVLLPAERAALGKLADGPQSPIALGGKAVGGRLVELQLAEPMDGGWFQISAPGKLWLSAHAERMRQIDAEVVAAHGAALAQAIQMVDQERNRPGGPREPLYDEFAYREVKERKKLLDLRLAAMQEAAAAPAVHGTPAGRPERVRAALQEALHKPSTPLDILARLGVAVVHVGDKPSVHAADRPNEPHAATAEASAAEAEEAEPSIVEMVSPTEHRTAAKRRDANIKSMWLAADLEANPRPLTNADRETLLEYSDWGGIGEGIEKYVDRFPPGFPVPEKRQLIHAYFTPPAVCAEIARVVRPLLPGLVATDGKVHALEPSAGIGRFPLALSGKGFEALAWHCVEYSTVSHKMLGLLRPEIDLFHGPFERWCAERGPDFAGRLKLLISNPPYGARNQAWTEDPDRSYRYKRADDYFLRRGLDLLGAGGLGIYIIPSGFLTGPSEDNRSLREEVLRRHHLAAAFRLPNEVFSLANVVTDILIFRARGGMLAKVDDADQFIVEGRYYEEFPGHILGEVVHHDPNDNRGWHHTAEGYTVVGKFTSIPPFEERPMCSSCQHLPAPAPVAPPPTPATGRANATAAQLIIASNERLAAAVALGRRVEAFLSSVGNRDIEPVGWQELHADLVQWVEAFGDEGQPANGPPGKDRELLALAAKELGPLGHDPPGGASWLLKAFLGKSNTLIPSLAHRPTWVPAFTGDANDPLQVGEYLFRTQGAVSVNELPGQDASPLFAAGWSEDSTDPDWTERIEVRGPLFPPTNYLFGHLWPKFDRADKRAKLGDVQAGAQARRLLEVMQPASWDEIEVTPQDGFVPIELLSAWLAKALNHGTPVVLHRAKGLVQVAGVEYDLHSAEGFLSLSGEAALCLGWVNHDYVVFQPYVSKDSNDTVDEVRLRYARDWTERFRAWCDADPERQRLIEQSYQRARQGYRIPTYGGEPLTIARWNPAVVLNPHQCAGARRADVQRGGGIAFDVGVGKTFAILATLALARQQGRARRAVIVVPQPIALQWVANVQRALPDFRVVVIGVNQRTVTRGLRVGMETSETDSAEERGQKWARFMGGEYDVAIITYEAMPRTQMDQAALLRFIEGVTDIEREVELRRRNAKREQKQRERSYQQKKSELEPKILRAKEELREAKYLNQKAKVAKLELKLMKLELKLKAAEDQYKNRKLTARQEAILEEGVGAWLAERLELPEGWKHDPITWQQLKIDWLAVDEAHNFKNLHMPSSREGGAVPKFMGNEGDGSHRAWHLYFRACDVQSRGGEVALATATPLSNSPLEAYNLGKLIDDGVWKRMGIHDPEAFIDRFCILEPEEVMTADMSTATRLACVGFKNLDELRSVMLAQWEFKTAEEAGLELPTATVETVHVDMNAAQDAKYDKYVKEIEDALSNPRKEGHKILGLLSRLASVAQHPQLDERFEWADAHLVKTPHCPKFDALAVRVMAKPGCGHIVFSDAVPAHAWIRDVLIEAGIPANRIGIMNAVVAPTAADRQRLAREFNGTDSALPKYDVLICNSIGEEGVDLQRRACAIHHMDIGWNPKKFTQRNGRGLRQGNVLGNIAIYYYVSNRSQDGMRLDMIDHKQNWISSLIAGANKINNPAAQSNLSRNEILLLISRNPEETRKRLDALKVERAEERKTKIIQNALATLRAVSNRFERARTDTNPAVVAENLSVAKQKLKSLVEQGGLAEVWPWATWAMEAERHQMLITKVGPVYETLRVAMPRVLDRSVLDHAEFGRIDGATIGTRVARAAHWDETSAEKVDQLRLAPEMRLDASGSAWPSDDQAGIDAAMSEKWLPRLHNGPSSSNAWTALGWTRAPDRFVAEQWARWGDQIVRGMAEMGGWAGNLQIPGVLHGRLVFGLGAFHAEIIPPTLAGWQRFLELAPTAGIKFGDIERAGHWWFGRTIPRTLLSAARDDAPASGSVPVSQTPASRAARAAV